MAKQTAREYIVECLEGYNCPPELIDRLVSTIEGLQDNADTASAALEDVSERYAALCGKTSESIHSSVAAVDLVERYRSELESTVGAWNQAIATQNLPRVVASRLGRVA